MSGRLANINIGSLKTGTRKPKAREVPSVAGPGTQISQIQILATIPTFQLLQQVPNIQPFLIPDLIPDLIYILESAGVQAIIDLMLPLGRPTPEGQPSREQLFRVFKEQGLDAFISTVKDRFNNPQELLNNIYVTGQRALTVLIQRADPNYPPSIIFRHPSQEVHANTQKIEIDIIKNEPEIVESEDLQCPRSECRSRRIARSPPVQIRSADEPATIFARCVACKIQWSFSAA